MQMAEIHPTAIVEDGAELGVDVVIGPYCVVGENVKLNDGVELKSHVVVSGNTEVGSGTRIFPFASIGHQPQDLKFGGEDSRLIIGSNTTIRENVTMNPGTTGGGMVTRVGDNCLAMASSHVAHDCQIGNNVVLVNCAAIGGHVIIGDFALIGGLSAVHQFCRIGAHAMIGGMTGVATDVIPYGSVMGNRAYLSGLNLIGLKRRGFSREVIHTLRNAYRLLFAPEGTLLERMADVEELYGDNELVRDIIEFMRVNQGRNICQPKDERDG